MLKERQQLLKGCFFVVGREETHLITAKKWPGEIKILKAAIKFLENSYD